MARWKLLTGHYLNTVDPTIWEHNETSRESGKSIRHRYVVPAFLNPNDNADHNYPGEGIIVAHADTAHERRDILFIGDPTPDMEPLDDEAEAISASLRQRWEHPIESLPATMTDGESAFMAKLMETFAGAAQASNASVPKADFDALKAELESIKAMLAAKSEPAAQSRRV